MNSDTPAERESFFVLKCIVAVIMTGFLLLFFLFLSPIFIFTYTQLAIRTVLGWMKKGRATAPEN